MAVYKRGKIWCYKFNWNGEAVRGEHEAKRVAEQMEATHKTSLAKGEVGLRDRKPAPTLREFAEGDFLPFVRSNVRGEAEDAEALRVRVKSLLAFEKIADTRLDAVTGGHHRWVRCEAARFGGLKYRA